MTEAEWEACGGIDELCRKFREEPPWPSARKLRLAGCAISRRVLHLLPKRKYRRAVDSAEELADGKLWPATRNEVRNALADALRGQQREDAPAGHAIRFAFAGGFPLDVSGCVLAALERAYRFDAKAELLVHARLFRDIVPFSPQEAVPERIRRWEGGTLERLAEDAYHIQQYPLGHLENDRLAILSDALEEAGCTDDAILAHLRSAGHHVRGCWALDLVLGRK